MHSIVKRNRKEWDQLRMKTAQKKKRKRRFGVTKIKRDFDLGATKEIERTHARTLERKRGVFRNNDERMFMVLIVVIIQE